jgi:hypothetical protein
MELPGQKGFMRLRQSTGDGCICEFAPMDGPIPQKVKGDSHLVWWEDDAEGFVASSPVLRVILRVNKPFAVELDYDGQLVKL